MQDEIMQSSIQPFIKLVQGNIELLTQFCASPVGISQAMSSALSSFQEGQSPAAILAPSNAFGELIQGMFKNYAEFMTELGQSGMAMLAQGQSAMMHRAQEAVEGVAVSDVRGRRAR